MALKFELGVFDKLVRDIKLIKREVLDDTGDFMVKEAQKAFKTRRFNNKNWKKLKQKSKSTGKLAMSLRKYRSVNSVYIFTPLNYAKYQNDGTKHIPARPFIKVTPLVIKFAKELLNKKLKECLR